MTSDFCEEVDRYIREGVKIGRLLWGGVNKHGTPRLSICGVPCLFTREHISIKKKEGSTMGKLGATAMGR